VGVDVQPDVEPGPDSGPLDCSENDKRACGPRDVGECRPGQETCEGGRWSACRGGIAEGTEVCDPAGLDENCDGRSNEICDCMAGDTQECGTDVGECSFGVSVCGEDFRWGPCSEEITTGEEICNGLDDDCNGSIDESVLSTFYLDEDGDGFGVGATMNTCTLPAGYATVAGDCDDDNDLVYPGAEELCNGRDDNCNGMPDEGLPSVTYYEDSDEDGYGTGAPITFCEDPGVEYATVDGDCNDTTAEVRPGGTEVCDTLDNDCSGGFDEGNVCACPGVNFAGHNYLFCLRDRNWSDSRNSCTGQGGGRYRLVIINDMAEQTFVQAEAGALAGRWWIGLDDNDTEGDFRWVDGTPQRNGGTIISYDNFAPGEPNNDWGEDCGEIRAGGLWNDRECNDDNNFICESYEP
jgi:hypothetical protein